VGRVAKLNGNEEQIAGIVRCLTLK